MWEAIPTGPRGDQAWARMRPQRRMWVVLPGPSACPTPWSLSTAKTEQHPWHRSPWPAGIRGQLASMASWHPWPASVASWHTLTLFCFQRVKFYSCLPFEAELIMSFANGDDGKLPFPRPFLCTLNMGHRYKFMVRTSGANRPGAGAVGVPRVGVWEVLDSGGT